MIAVGGENLIDLVQQDDGRYVAHPGGSPMNVAMALARQGADVHYLTPVSTDSMGDLIAERLVADQVTMSAPRNPAPTSLAVVSLTNGVASYQFYREGTAERKITIDTLTETSPTELKAFHIGSLAVSAGSDADSWVEFYLGCKDRGIMTCYDPNIRAALIPDRAVFFERFERLIKATDILKLSDEDLEWLYPDVGIEDAFDRLVRSSSAQLIVLTRGQYGAWAQAGALQSKKPAAFVENLVDTVGAGDTFMATLIRQMLDRGCDFALTQDDLDSMISTASRAAAFNCGRAGCQPPSLQNLES